MSIVKVGTCGWSVRGGRKAYFAVFKLIEIQQTFYRLPRVATAEKWRKEAPEDFEYTMKAWQVITHPPSSPSWRKAKIEVPPESRDKYGFLKPTEENLKAWEKTLEVAKALGATFCVFQTPPSFGYSEENVKNVEEFFSTIERGSLVLGWEPRGTWNQYVHVVKVLVDKLDLVHVVDILRRDPVSTHEVAYFRLHGLGGREVNYKYKYTDADLLKLAEKVKEFSREKSRIYVLFNNIYMADDAQRFRKIASKLGIEVI